MMDITREEFYTKFENALKRNGLEKYLSGVVCDRLYRLTNLILESKSNVTAITDVDEIIDKHYVDSMLSLHLYHKNSKVIDVGCGGGFPSLVYAVLRDDLSVFALDSNGKKTEFVQTAKEELSLENLTVITARSEELAHDAEFREKFDYATARAVARLNILAELCLGFVKVGGKLIALKSKSAVEETNEAMICIEKLSSDLCEVEGTVLRAYDGEEYERNTVIIEKVGKLKSEYPRNYSRISKRPL